MLFRTDLAMYATRTKLHFENLPSFTETITGNPNGNMLLTPGPRGKMHLLHHGFPCLTDTGYSLVFVQGNFSDCSYFKVLNRTEATANVGVQNCPSLESMLNCTSEAQFTNLPPSTNGILREFPNHILIDGDMFLLANGVPMVSAAMLANQIIDFVRIQLDGDDPDDEDEVEAKQETALGAEALLAMLWASEAGILTPVNLMDVPNSATVNESVRNIKEKLRVTASPSMHAHFDEDDRARRDDVAASAWAVSSQSIVQELTRMHESREAERATKEASMSLLKTLNPSQKKLFTTLCTESWDVEPTMSPFMTNLTMAASPQKAIGVLKVEAGDWEGTFSEGCCHRFLSNGFLSLDASRGLPGGFTVFMFHPKTIDMGTKAYDSTTATLREYFDLDVEDATVAFYAKQGFFHPTNAHDLRIQLETALEMLELMTCPRSIATEGLHYIVNPKMWRRYSTRIHDRFLTDRSFGSQFLYCVDLTLQTFFDRVARDEDCQNFLLHKARELMDKLQSGSTLGIQLPSVLTSREDKPSPPKRGRLETGTSERPKAKPVHHPSEEHRNMSPHGAWLCPAGKNFLDLFKDRAPGGKTWPKIVDERLPKKKKQFRAAPLCVRFQMTAKCTHGCVLAHVFAKNLSKPEFNHADKLFKDALAEI